MALVAAVVIVTLATFLHRVSESIEASTHGVRVAEEAQVDLLLHAQAKSSIVRRNLSGSLRLRLGEADVYVETDRERLLLDDAKARVDEYLLASRDAGRAAAEVDALRVDAFAALERLVIVNVEQASEQVRWAARVDYLANIGGLVMAFAVLGSAFFFLYWVRGPLIRPVGELAQAMREFGQGEHTIRARIAGPRELEGMAERFNEMAAQIERQRERQRAFLAGVAHDLRNPVNALLLSNEVARSDASLPPDHRVRRALERNVRQLRNLDRMISDFLDAAAIEAGQLELRVELCDMRDILRATVEIFEEASSPHEVVFSVPREPIQARIDPLRVEQVAINLISNAIKYSPDGGPVEIRLERRNDELMVAVTDHGLGMPSEAHSRLFEPFRRGLSREGIPGVGLGLFVVRRIVEAHHGRIEVESSPGAGSTFRVFLPAVPSTERTSAEEARAAGTLH